jgi:hypothetical protein
VELDKPTHFAVAEGHGRWLARNTASLAALAIGVIGLVVVTVSQDALWTTPDPRLTVPLLAAAATASTIAIVRREKAYPAWLVGLGVSLATLVLGWFVMVAIVVVATAILVAILHAVM